MSWADEFTRPEDEALEEAIAMGLAYWELGLTMGDVGAKTAGMNIFLRLAVNQGWWRGEVNSKRAGFAVRSGDRG